MRKIALVFLIIISTLIASGQSLTKKLIVKIDLKNARELPLKIYIEKTSLGGYKVTDDTCKVKDWSLKYETRIFEPEFVKIFFYWKSKRLTSASFWAMPSTYYLIVANDLQPLLTNQDNSDLAKIISDMEDHRARYKVKSDSLLRNINYENKKIEDVERRVNFIKDSIDNLVDENVYKANVLHYLGSPLGLYALCRYAERPYTKQRFRYEQKEVEDLFKLLTPEIKKLPSAQILLTKLSLSKRLVIGNKMIDISLPDTAGRIVRMGEFRGRFLLIDFWASWCIPCRAENQSLRSAYAKYKDLGFEIISITLDNEDNKQKWLKAIEQDKTTKWPQLSDFKKIAQKTYDIRFIPTNYLINRDGVIIERDLRGEELQQKLEKIFITVKP
ncbi:TlpA disulfide reductase family protein [Pedobacter nutrimenti]|uniref:peroxiredoxin family protein n=1 Tax=Pedobacter nutrimenti TaxID=1241337 RepID=UPI00293036D1|nr:TlpA disulfide reductase family protein [Pedobacter nutrimenti]